MPAAEAVPKPVPRRHLGLVLLTMKAAMVGTSPTSQEMAWSQRWCARGPMKAEEESQGWGIWGCSLMPVLRKAPLTEGRPSGLGPVVYCRSDQHVLLVPTLLLLTPRAPAGAPHTPSVAMARSDVVMACSGHKLLGLTRLGGLYKQAGGLSAIDTQHCLYKSP